MTFSSRPIEKLQHRARHSPLWQPGSSRVSHFWSGKRRGRYYGFTENHWEGRSLLNDRQSRQFMQEGGLTSMAFRDEEKQNRRGRICARFDQPGTYFLACIRNTIVALDNLAMECS